MRHGAQDGGCARFFEPLNGKSEEPARGGLLV